MTLISRNARIAGFMYLLLMVVPLRLIYIPGALFVKGDATATAHNIATHEMLFRLGMLGDLWCGVVLIFMVLAFYRLFHAVDRTLAVLVIFLGGLLPSAIYFFNVANDAAALLLVRGADFLSVFTRSQLDALAMLFLRLHAQEVVAAEILWGLWLFPLGLLVYRSRFLPRVLGIWLIINGVAYLAQSVTGLLLPDYEDMVAKFAFPAQLGEIALMLWLLVMGAKERTPSTRMPS